MPVNENIFGGVWGDFFGQLFDVATYEEPWGLGVDSAGQASGEHLKFGVLRLDHEDYQAWSKKNTSNKMATTVKRFMAKEMYRQDSPGDVKPGELMGRMIDSLPDEELEMLFTRELSNLKPGIAAILLREPWPDIRRPDGAVLEDSLENKLQLLGWEGVLISETPKGGGAIVPHFLTKEQFAEQQGRKKYPAIAALEEGRAVVHEFAGNPRRPDGSLLTIKEGLPFGPALAGDGFANFFLDCAMRGSLTRARTLKEGGDSLEEPPNGEGAISAG